MHAAFYVGAVAPTPFLMLAWRAVYQPSYSPALRDASDLCEEGTLQCRSKVVSVWLCPPGHISSMWQAPVQQNVSVRSCQGTLPCLPSTVHLSHPSIHSSCPFCGGSLQHRAMGVSTPCSLANVEQVTLVVGKTALTKSTQRDIASHQERWAEVALWT